MSPKKKNRKWRQEQRLREELEAINQVPHFLYHGTSPQAAAEIMKDGLRPPSMTGAAHMADNNLVFLAEDDGVAAVYGLIRVSLTGEIKPYQVPTMNPLKDKNEIALLTIDTAQLDSSCLTKRLNDAFGFEFVYSEAISPSAIRCEIAYGSKAEADSLMKSFAVQAEANAALIAKVKRQRGLPTVADVYPFEEVA